MAFCVLVSGARSSGAGGVNGTFSAGMVLSATTVSFVGGGGSVEGAVFVSAAGGLGTCDFSSAKYLCKGQVRSIVSLVPT